MVFFKTYVAPKLITIEAEISIALSTILSSSLINPAIPREIGTAIEISACVSEINPKMGSAGLTSDEFMARSISISRFWEHIAVGKNKIAKKSLLNNVEIAIKLDIITGI